MCDAQDGVTAQDLRVAELAMQSGCATLLVLNKWDVAQDVDLDHERARVATKLRLRPRVLTASADTGRGVAARRCARRSRSPTARRAASRPPSSTASSSELVAARQPPAAEAARAAASSCST